MDRSDSRSVDQFFSSRGSLPRIAEPRAGCLTDEQLAGYAASLLPARDRHALSCHLLECHDCHELLTVLLELRETAAGTAPLTAGAASRAGEPATLRIFGRLVESGLRRGLQILNEAELVIRSLAPAGATPALGALRGPDGATAASDLLFIRGPGSGLDELELAVRTDGTACLTVHCHQPPALRPGESLSVLLHVDGALREQRPHGAEPVRFAPLAAGDHRVQLLARAAGQPARPLAEVSLQLAR